MPFVVCRCEPWSLTLRKRPELRVFENLVLRKIFRPKRNYLRGEWRRVAHEVLYVLYSTPIVIRMIKSKMRWAGHMARVVERRMHAVFW